MQALGRQAAELLEAPQGAVWGVGRSLLPGGKQVRGFDQSFEAHGGRLALEVRPPPSFLSLAGGHSARHLRTRLSVLRTRRLLACKPAFYHHPMLMPQRVSNVFWQASRAPLHGRASKLHTQWCHSASLQVQELEDVANAAAKRVNRVRAQLAEGEQREVGALLALLPPALDLAAAGTPTSAGRSAALDRGHAPLTTLCNTGAAAALFAKLTHAPLAM